MTRQSSDDTPVIWSLEMSPTVCGDAAWCAQLIANVRPRLEAHLREHPQATALVLPGTYFALHLRHVSGAWRAGSQLLVHYRAELHRTQERERPAGSAELQRTILPDEFTRQLAGRLIGLQSIAERVLLDLACRWEDRLDTWSAQMGVPIGEPIRSQFQDTCPLYVFTGPPGVGKTALSRTIGDAWCRNVGTTGLLISLDTSVRGNGLVNSFGNCLRSAFAAAKDAAAAGTPCFLLCDEADSIGMRRDETAAHQEDRAGCNTLLQALDNLIGHKVAVFLTTNLVEQLDPAVLRRGVVIELSRPDHRTRQALITHCLPQLSRRLARQVATASVGMTHADLQRAATDLVLEAVSANTLIDERQIERAFRRGTRTGDVSRGNFAGHARD